MPVTTHKYYHLLYFFLQKCVFIVSQSETLQDNTMYLFTMVPDQCLLLLLLTAEPYLKEIMEQQLNSINTNHFSCRLFF